MTRKLHEEVLVECPLCDQYLPRDDEVIVRHYLDRHRGRLACNDHPDHLLHAGISLVNCWCGWGKGGVDTGLHTTLTLVAHMRERGGVLLHAKACLLGVEQ